VFNVNDEEYAEFKKKIREVAASMGRSDAAKRISKDFSVYLLDFLERGDRALGILVGVVPRSSERTRSFFGKNPIRGLTTRLNIGNAFAASPQFAHQIKTLGSKEREIFLFTAGIAWVRLRVWASVLKEEFRCIPLEQMKASELRAYRKKKSPSKDGGPGKRPGPDSARGGQLRQRRASGAIRRVQRGQRFTRRPPRSRPPRRDHGPASPCVRIRE